jgi:hypothetical protein
MVGEVLDMNKMIQKKMIDFKIENGAKKADFTADEWSAALGMTISHQRLAAMCRDGLVVRHKNPEFYGDNKYRYDVK